MTELTPSELTLDLLLWARDRAYPECDEHPVWRWERWIEHDPERAWLVFEALIREAPADAEVIEQLARRLELLLARHWTTFHERALLLTRSAPLLDHMLGPEVFIEDHYSPRYRDVTELATVWLRRDAHFEHTMRVSGLMRTDPDLGLPLALEIIHRGPLHGFDPWDVHVPLLELLRWHGLVVLARVETVAQRSAGVRQVLWQVRRLRHSYPMAADLWERLMTLAEPPSPDRPALSGVRTALGGDAEELLDGWFVSEAAAWAHREVDELLRADRAQGWAAVQALVQQATTEQALSSIGAGPLEDLVRRYPADLINEVERMAQVEPRFRRALAGAWLTLEDVPRDLAHRYWAASGKELQVLDAPEDWPSEHDGA
jgi:hypothetical protein